MTAVEYSLKELLDRIDKKLDAFALRLDLKAERAHVEAIDRRVAAVENQLATAAAIGKSRSWLLGRTWGVVVGVVGLISAIAGTVYAVAYIASH